MRRQLNSFKVAFKGIWYAIKSESHMRFHLVTGFYVILFSFFFGLSKAQWGVVLILITSIITAEVFNTAIEEVCNLNTESYDPLVRIAKDVAAGAVLVLSFAAVAIAFIFYFDIGKITAIALFILTTPWLLILFIVSIIMSLVFIVMGPMGFTKIYHRFKVHTKK